MMRNGFGVTGSVWPMGWSGLLLVAHAFALLLVYSVVRRSQPVARTVRSQAPSVLRALEEKHSRDKIPQEELWVPLDYLNKSVE